MLGIFARSSFSLLVKAGIIDQRHCAYTVVCEVFGTAHGKIDTAIVDD